MAIILNIKQHQNKLLYKVSCTKQEFIQLGYAYHKVHFFKDQNYSSANIYTAGMNQNQKYFIIPNKWILHRKQKKVTYNVHQASLQRIDYIDRAFFIYTIPTSPFSKSDVLSVL
jgi:hypothetical protein